MAAAKMTTARRSDRPKREECARTKHDCLFSNWKVLIGPTDWEDYSLGKDGVERYRICNLPPSCSCPGLYELGVAVTSPNDDGRRTRKDTPDKIIVVYLGQSDNVRTRLQEYGRAGSHLDHGSSSVITNISQSSCLRNGPRLFSDMFSKGYSVLYRWAPMNSKEEAEKREAQLLEFFDYAWNTRGNGDCRHRDILLKLGNKSSSMTATILDKLQIWKYPLFGKSLGIKIGEDITHNEAGAMNDKGFLPQILKFIKSRPQIVQRQGISHEDKKICGVAIGNGYVCTNKPLNGRKRCTEHKGRKISGIKLRQRRVKVLEGKSFVSSVSFQNGSTSTEKSHFGIKGSESYEAQIVLQPEGLEGRCSESDVEARIVIQPESLKDRLLNPTGSTLCKTESPPSQRMCGLNEGESNICGIILGDGSACSNRPISGRKRCNMHKGRRITVTKLLISSKSSLDTGAGRDKFYEDYICGVFTDDGLQCRRKPAHGRKRCDKHKGQRMITTSSEILIDGSGSSICGVMLEDGSMCRNFPDPRRKRCALHKGQRLRQLS